MGSGASQPIPEHLSQTKEEDDYLVIGSTASERTEVGPDPSPKYIEVHQKSASPPPPSYQDVGSTDRNTQPGCGSHPAADIPFALHPRLQVIVNLENPSHNSPVAQLEPLDLDKYLYDFSLEEDIRSSEGYRGIIQH